MFDLSQVTDLAKDLLGGASADGGLAELTQHLDSLGLDASQFDSLASEELMSVLAEQGLELGQLDAQMLADLVEQAGIELPFTDASGPL